MDDTNLTPEQQAARERARKGLMNIEDQAFYDEYIQMNPRDLSPDQQHFMTARRGYMNDQQLEVFQDMIDKVLEENEQKVRDERPEVATDTEVDDNGVYIAKKDRK